MTKAKSKECVLDTKPKVYFFVTPSISARRQENKASQSVRPLLDTLAILLKSCRCKPLFKLKCLVPRFAAGAQVKQRRGTGDSARRGGAVARQPETQTTGVPRLGHRGRRRAGRSGERIRMVEVSCGRPPNPDLWPVCRLKPQRRSLRRQRVLLGSRL